jgi:TPP-dependent pyruvate/acetoin dehydrogenase alpha subunit
MKEYTKEELIAFETDIADCFNNGEIRAPVHLYFGNENEMINVFKKVSDGDWIFTTWRSHYQCLLKGVPPEVIKKDVIEGKSITLCYPEYKIYSVRDCNRASAVLRCCSP